MSKFWNETTKRIDPYVPGEQPKDKKYIKLNTNENPYGPSPLVKESMINAINDDLKLYPDPTCSDLIATIANYYNIDEDEIFVGNGSDEVLAFVFKAFFDKDKKVKFPDISYSFYPVYSVVFNVNAIQVPLDDNFNIPLDKMMDNTTGIVLPNPNAPTSKFIETSDLCKLVEANKDNVVVIDEAYVDFGGESMVKYINKYDNLLVIQTLSKSRSLAGLRGGFAFGNKELIEGLNRVKNSFNSYTLDRVALSGTIAAFKDEEYFNSTRNKIIKTREWSVEALKELGFTVLDSRANFIFVSHCEKSGEYLYNTLKDNGILVRYFNKPRIDNYLRITIGTDDEMKTLIDTLKKIL